MKYLNKDCEFKCTNGAIFEAYITQNSVKMNKSFVLTDKSQFSLKMPVTCPLANNNPCPGGLVTVCNPVASVKVQRQNVLTDSSYLICTLGQKLNPTKSSKITDGAEKPQVSSIKSNIEYEKKKVASTVSQNSGDTSEKNTKTVSGKNETYVETSMCKGCGYDGKCPYKNASGESGNDSATLRSNYKAVHSDEYYRTEDIIKKAGTRSAAHHMISGNQAFAHYTKLLKLANCILNEKKLYDINNDENCILLPTSLVGFGEKDASTKQKTAYDIMDNTGMQFHSGSHDYPIPYDNLMKDRRYSVYADVVKEKLANIADYIEKVDSCPYKDESLKEAVLKGLYKLQHEIREKLNKFRNNPTKSYPYYVSRISLQYAFAIQTTVNVVVLIKNGDGVDAVFSRYNNDLKRGLQYITEKSKKSFLLPLSECKIEFIKFCKNAIHIIVSDDDISLPFKTYHRKVMPVTYPIEASLRGMMDELSSFIHEHPIGYSGEIKIIERRLSE